MTESTPLNLRERIELIEAGYEYMLAYAAQGYEADQHPSQDVEARSHLENMDRALHGLGNVAHEAALAVDADNVALYESFIRTVGDDAERARGAVRLVLSRPSISSQLVDNLNASIHLRALLTDLFLLDEALPG